MINITKPCLATRTNLSNFVHDIVAPGQRVFFSLYDEVEYQGREDGDNLVRFPDIKSKIPLIEGKVKLLISDQYINPLPVFSPELSNPTWKDVLQTANNMLANCVTQIGFLENIQPYDAGTYQLIFSH